MKKYTQLLIVLALVLAVIGVATNNSAWAGPVPGSQNAVADAKSGVANLLQTGPVTVTATGSYNVEGVCSFDVKYKKTTRLQDNADARIPRKESEKIPFTGEGQEKLIFPGCHIVHNKDGKVIKEVDAKDGTWQVCFGTNPSLKIRIYFYFDKSVGESVWIPLPTKTSGNGVSCASAPYTGVYMPAGQPSEKPVPGKKTIVNPGPQNPGGSVVVPPSDITVSAPGTYAIGGICAMIIQYKVENLSDRIFVHQPTEANDLIPFPDNGGMLDLPGCHVIHFEASQIQQEMTADQGEWEICFAARPNKTYKIYYYRDDLTSVAGPWLPLETTTEKGLACAHGVNFSAVYAPAEQP